ncbi:DNA-directed RNA polymerase [Coemansia sp. RSA 1722]|nr:DNA-directed RNA polymerase [Coemansia sp. RSA 1722]
MSFTQHTQRLKQIDSCLSNNTSSRRFLHQVAKPKEDDQSFNEDSWLFASADSSPVILKDVREDSSSVHYLQTGKSLNEQLSVMQACLVNGNVDRAQRMLIGLYKLYPEAMKEIADVSVHNEIISGLLAAKPQPLTTEALLWYDQLERTYMIKPNANTFAIMIRGFIKNDMRNVGIVLMQELLRSGLTFNNMLHSAYLSDQDIDQIKQVARSIVDEGHENKDLATKLIEAVGSAEKQISEYYQKTEETTDNTKMVKGHASVTRVGKENKLISSGVTGIVQLKNTLKSLYSNELEGYNLQMRLERDTYDSEIARCREVNKKRGDPLLSADRSQIRQLTAQWLPQLEALIEEEQARCKKALDTGTDRVRMQYGKFLTQLDAPKIAIITILETLRLNAIDVAKNLSESTLKYVGIKTVTLVLTLSNAIHNEIRFEKIKHRSNRHILARNMSVAKLASSGKLFNMTMRRAEAMELKDSSREWLDSWDIATKTRIGSMLVSMLIEVARVTESSSDPKTGVITKRMVPAFIHKNILYRGLKYGVISPHGVLREVFKKDSIASTMNARYLPMLIPPRPWLTYNAGGYLTQNEPCVRMKDNVEQLRYLKIASDQDKLHTLLAGLDSLGLTKWAINRSVFDVVRKVWNSGIELAGIPATSYSAPEPVKPVDYETNKKAYLEYMFQMREWNNGIANQHSQRCDCNYKVEIAQAFLNHPMYFPHNIDFRGRAYPIPPHFNHLGNDLCRGLLLFDEGRPLTERGLFWLKIHMANLYGKDKLSHDERVKFIDENYDRILESADNPIPEKILQGNVETPLPWWLESENPWQSLASCVEFAAAMRSPNPAEYVSHLHIHQDGTCNGLQHYAAMGRDNKGAFEVNLIPSDKPQDVYQGILNIVDRLIEEDAKNGVREAVLLRGKLTRKIVKQTVMTNVYGVTLIGAREQISARLREIKDEHGNHEFELVEISKISMYVAKKIFDSLGEIFTQAQEIQNWLNQSASRIARSMPASALAAWKHMIIESKESRKKLRKAISDAKKSDTSLESEKVMELNPNLGPGSMRRKRLNHLATKPMNTVVWTTPLGLTVVQPYRKFTVRNISTPLQQISVRDSNMPSPVNSQKQKTAFPPNFVHSLDASHMILSAIECRVAGLVFASVHDSYWTHACDIDKMNAILRDQFIKLHQRPIMEDLKAEFENRYSTHMMPTVQWEYMTKSFSSSKSSAKSTKKASNAVESSEAVQERERMAENEIGIHHLEVCGEIDDSVKGLGTQPLAATEPYASTKQITMKEIDLNDISIIDPKEDLIAAMKQADQIEYTVSKYKERMQSEIKLVETEHLQQIKDIKSQIRSLKKKRANGKSAAKAALNSKKGSAASTTDAAVTSDVAEPNTAADKELEAAVGKLSAKVADIKAKMKAEVVALEKKHTPPISAPSIFIGEQEMTARSSEINKAVLNGKLSGALVKRIKWEPIKFDPLPAHGDFKLEMVADSPYFFS